MRLAGDVALAWAPATYVLSNEDGADGTGHPEAKGTGDIGYQHLSFVVMQGGICNASVRFGVAVEVRS